MPDLSRLVFDTNSLLSGLANRNSASGRVLGHCQSRRALLLMSRPVQAEYRRVLGSAEMLRRNPQITPEAIELVLRHLRYVGQYYGHVTARFRLDRDLSGKRPITKNQAIALARYFLVDVGLFLR